MASAAKSYWMDRPPKNNVEIRASDIANTTTTTTTTTTAYDVIVIGAGISGVGVASWLRREGYKGSIALVECREGVAEGATGRNAGHVWPYPNHGWEQEGARLLADVAKELGCEFNRLKSVDLVRTRSLEAAPTGTAELWERWRIKMEIPILKRDVFWAGVCEKNGGSMSSYEFTRALFAATPDITLLHGTALSYTEEGALTLDDGRILHANQHIVFACNANIRSLVPALDITPVRGQALHLELIDDAVPDLRVAVAMDTSFQYAVPTGKRSLLYGGARMDGEEHGVLDDTTLSAEISQRLRRYLQKYFGLSPHQYRVTHEWTGIMGFTPDERPFIGRVPGSTRHFVLGGFSGEGLPKAFLGARCIAQMIVGLPVAFPIPEKWNPNRKPEHRPPDYDGDATTEEEEDDDDDDDEEEDEEDDGDEEQDEKQQQQHQQQPALIALPQRIGMVDD